MGNKTAFYFSQRRINVMGTVLCGPLWAHVANLAVLTAFFQVEGPRLSSTSAGITSSEIVYL